VEVLREAFPDYTILTEERGELAGEGEARWIVNPLDGTTNYAHELPLFRLRSVGEGGRGNCGSGI